jgi:hypothetical protein
VLKAGLGFSSYLNKFDLWTKNNNN